MLIKVYKNIFLSVFLFLITSVSYGQLLNINSETASFIDATTFNPKNNVLLLFSGSSLMLYDVNSDEMVKPKWFQLDGFKKIEAAFMWSDEQVLIFESNQYRIFNVSTAQFLSKKQEWLGLPEEWKGEFDAAVRWDEDNVMFCKDDKYLIYNFKESKYTIYDYLTSWEGWPEQWNKSIEAIFSFGDSIYFLNDGKAIEYSKSKGAFFSEIKISSE